MATSSEKIVFSRDDLNLIVAFAGCSLDEKPGSNYVQDNGGLPDYICRIAKAVKKTGKTTSQAIAIAISRVRVWSTGKGVDKDTQAKAAAAVAEYEALLARTHAKTAAKKTAKLSHSRPAEILCLSDSVTVFNVDAVRSAWNQQTSAWRKKFDSGYPVGTNEEPPPYSYIKEMWTDHLIVCAEGPVEQLFRVDYTVSAEGEVVFQQPIAVKTQYVAIEERDMVGNQMSNSELRQLMATVGPCYSSATDKVLLSIDRKPSALSEVLSHQHQPSALAQVLARKGGPSALAVVLSHQGQPGALAQVTAAKGKTSAVETFLGLTDKGK